MAADVISLLSGLYEYTELDKSLLMTATNQRLSCISVNKISEEYKFKYTDSDVSFEFTGVNKGRGYKGVLGVILPELSDTNKDKANEVIIFEIPFADYGPELMPYGLWRRLVFFLMDAVPIWFYMQQPESQRFWKLLITGGWLNSEWSTTAKIMFIVKNNYGKERLLKSLSYPERNKTITLFPLDAYPKGWGYHEGKSYSEEIKLETKPSDNPVDKHVVLSTPINKQLKQFPFYFREDKEAYIFLRFVERNFHRGEDDAPIPWYCYANKDCAFDIRAHYIYGVDTFKNLISFSKAMDRIFMETSTADGKIKFSNFDSITMHMTLREELFFALYDINGIDVPINNRPVIYEKNSKLSYSPRTKEQANQYLQRVIFGTHLDEFDGLPVTMGSLGICTIDFRHSKPAIQNQHYIQSYNKRKKTLKNRIILTVLGIIILFAFIGSI